ncbi:MAG: glycolate oxidase subunit GlcE [Albidovulum sp.]
MQISSEQDLAEVIRAAQTPLVIRGGGTRPVGRPVAGGVLDVSGLSGITLYEPAALTVVAKAGTPLAEVEAALAVEGQRLAFEPSDWRALLGTSGTPTVGGMVAANSSGPRRVQAGACRDALLGVRFVDGAGSVVKSGGRVMKNVTGYDLAKLIAGSWGTLGVISEVSLKVLPAPDQVVSLHLDGLDGGDAVAAMAAALGSPYEVTAAVHHRGTSPCTRFRLEGFAGSVAYRAGALAKLLARFGSWHVSDEPRHQQEEWRRIRDLAPFCGVEGDVWRLAVKPSDAPALIARSGARDEMIDWGGALIWLLVAPGTDLRARLGPYSGHATLIRATPETRAGIAPFQPEAPALAALSAGLRARFDPKGILNPGLMGG